jgi:hypothetical protein
MDSLDYWRLCDELSVVQAALLIVGIDPSAAEDVEEMATARTPEGYKAAKTAISRALMRSDIDGRISPVSEYDINGNECGEVRDSLDINSSWISVESLRNWLRERGFRTGFFFPEETDAPEYLDPLNPRYAPKLAAAVQAWQALHDPSLLKGKSPKQVLMKWLREHAPDFSLADEDGKPNETGIEEVAKVANWRPTGGAPKTPG